MSSASLDILDEPNLQRLLVRVVISPMKGLNNNLICNYVFVLVSNLLIHHHQPNIIDSLTGYLYSFHIYQNVPSDAKIDVLCSKLSVINQVQMDNK